MMPNGVDFSFLFDMSTGADVGLPMCPQVLVPLIAYVGAPASGAHFNPIVTFSFMVTGVQVCI